jgi:hypothetical protein
LVAVPPAAAFRTVLQPPLNHEVPRRGLRPLLSFLITSLATGVIAAVAWQMAGDPPRWPLALIVGLPSFVVAFLLPAMQRRRIQIVVGAVATLIAVAVAALFVFILILESQCPPDAYECPF